MGQSLKIGLFLFVFLIPIVAFSQLLTASDTSEKSVKRIQGIIKNNRELVNFIEYSLKSRGVPKHLRNLAIIESGLDHLVVSHAGAKGLWQFMVVHANHYGLTDNERSDIYKSTKTVVSSLINLYKKYGNWVTVVAAYNCGEGNIQKAMNNAGSKKYTDFEAYLPAETRGHVQKFLNACYATGELEQVLNDYYKTSSAKSIANTSKKTIDNVKKKNVESGKKIKKDFSETLLNSAYSLDVIAKSLKISKEDILKWNPTIEKKLAERGECLFYLPDHKMMEFEMNRNHILSESLKQN